MGTYLKHYCNIPEKKKTRRKEKDMRKRQSEDGRLLPNKHDSIRKKMRRAYRRRVDEIHEPHSNKERREEERQRKKEERRKEKEGRNAQNNTQQQEELSKQEEHRQRRNSKRRKQTIRMNIKRQKG